MFVEDFFFIFLHFKYDFDISVQSVSFRGRVEEILEKTVNII